MTDFRDIDFYIFWTLIAIITVYGLRLLRMCEARVLELKKLNRKKPEDCRSDSAPNKETPSACVVWAKRLHEDAPASWVAIDASAGRVVGEVHADGYDDLWDAELHYELPDGTLGIEIVKQKCLRIEQAKGALEKALGLARWEGLFEKINEKSEAKP